MSVSLKRLFIQGGAGSGHYGHKGRKGEVGGSLPEGQGGSTELSSKEMRSMVPGGEDIRHGRDFAYAVGSKIAKKWNPSEKGLQTYRDEEYKSYAGKDSLTKEDIVQGMFADWTGSSGGPDVEIIIKHVADRQGIENSINEHSWFDENAPELKADLQSLGDVIYKETQDYFKSKGITHVKLYRSGLSEKVNPAFTSWSVNYGGFITTDPNRRTYVANVPVEQIFSLSSTGFGNIVEGEVVVMGSVKAIKENGLFVHGGPGSGFHGHHGRPGEVGGSQKEEGVLQAPKPGETEEEWQARLARRRARRKARKEREKQKPPEEGKPQEVPPRVRRKGDRHARVHEIVTKLGYPVDKVRSHTQKGYAFTVGDQSFRAGAEYNRDTGVIQIFNINNLTTSQMEGMLAHEIQHAHYNYLRQQSQAQFVEVSRMVRKYEDKDDWPILASGDLKPEYKDQFWAYDIDHQYLGPSSKYAPDLDRLDGVSSYSKSYWNKAKSSGSGYDYSQAINETLAEIARIKVGSARTGDVVSIDPLWDNLYTSIKRRTGGAFGNQLFLFGGPGSGYKGRAGRPGEVGGSAPSGTRSTFKRKKNKTIEVEDDDA